MRSALITYEVTDAWEAWYIDITDPNAPDEITPEWLLNNRESWEFFDIKDTGYGEIKADTLVVESSE